MDATCSRALQFTAWWLDHTSELYLSADSESVEDAVISCNYSAQPSVSLPRRMRKKAPRPNWCQVLIWLCSRAPSGTPGAAFATGQSFATANVSQFLFGTNPCSRKTAFLLLNSPREINGRPKRFSSMQIIPCPPAIPSSSWCDAPAYWQVGRAGR